MENHAEILWPVNGRVSEGKHVNLELSNDLFIQDGFGSHVDSSMLTDETLRFESSSENKRAINKIFD